LASHHPDRERLPCAGVAGAVVRLACRAVSHRLLRSV